LWCASSCWGIPVNTDVSRVDAATQWFHAALTVPIQVILVQLGPPALAGFALFVVPLQERIMLGQFRMRQVRVVHDMLR
jgi:hypothetical protein